MPAPAREPLRSTRSRRARAPRAWPGARDAIPRPSWVGCTPIPPRVLTRSGFAAPAADPPLRSDCGGASRRRLRRPAYGRHPTPRGGRPGTTVDPEAAGAVCARALRPPLLPRDDPHSPAPPHAVVEASCRGSKLSWKQAVVEASCRGSKLSWKQAVVEASCRGSKLSWKQAVVEASCRGSKLSWKQAVVEEGQEAARPGRSGAATSVYRATPGRAGRRPTRPASAGLSG